MDNNGMGSVSHYDFVSRRILSDQLSIAEILEKFAVSRSRFARFFTKFHC
jgi:hypothetical protein